jgi:hypothetical protein
LAKTNKVTIRESKPEPKQNRILAALTAADYQRLLPHPRAAK